MLGAIPFNEIEGTYPIIPHKWKYSKEEYNKLDNTQCINCQNIIKI